MQIYGIAKLKKHGRWINKRAARGLQGSIYTIQPGNQIVLPLLARAISSMEMWLNMNLFFSWQEGTITTSLLGTIMRSLGYNPSAEELKVRQMLHDKTKY